MRSAEPAAHVETYQTLGSLPADAEPLFASATTFFSSRAWWDAVLTHALPPEAEPRLLLVRLNGEAAGLFPMLLDRAGLRALTTPYTCRYDPLVAPGCIDRAAVFTAMARYCGSFPTTRLDALDQGIAAEIIEGGTRAGLAVAGFDHFGNWHEDVTNLDWAGYLAGRPGELRETIRRRTRRAEGVPGADFRLFVSHNDIELAVTAFETVYARSWKRPEPYPAFNSAQISAAVATGPGRLGVWSIGGRPAAAQFWIVEHGCATVLKLAHDDAFKAHSPGTVLTAWMIRHMIEREHVAELDFGRGDDPYKQGWVACRGQRVGLMLINRRHPAGMMALARHNLGRVRARLRLTW